MGKGVDENEDPSSEEIALLCSKFPKWNLLNCSVTPSNLCRAAYLNSLKQVFLIIGFQLPRLWTLRCKVCWSQHLGRILPWSMRVSPVLVYRELRLTACFPGAPAPLEEKSLCSSCHQALEPVLGWGLDLVSLSTVRAYWPVCSSGVGGGGHRHGPCY